LESLCFHTELRGLKAVLTSSAATGRHHLILKAAQSLGLPVLLWQHGFVGYDEKINQLYDYSDRMTADATLVYGEGARKAYAMHGKDFPSRLITVGSAQLSRLTPIFPPRTAGKILYATTNYYGNYWYFGFRPGWSDNLFYRDQKIILEALEKIRLETGQEIMVKLHPSNDFPSPPWAKDLKGREGWKVIKDEAGFVDLAWEAEAVILDCPSTTLLQAIALGTSVFSLMRHWTYHPEILSILKKRAVCEESPETLMEQVSRFVTTRTYPADRKDMEFLKRFGGFVASDTSAAKQAVDAIHRLLSEPELIRKLSSNDA
jgi:hypothetical protein